MEAARLLWGALHGLGHDLRRRLEPALREHGLTTPLQVFLLGVLYRRGAQRLVDAARLMGFPVSTLSESADHLVSESLVTRRANPGDRRSVLLEVTPRGAQVLAAVQAQVIHRIEGILAGFDEAQVGALLGALRALGEQLGTDALDVCNWWDTAGMRARSE